MDKKREISYNFLQKVISLKEKIETEFLLFGQMLMKVRDEELFRGSYDDFSSFCEELKISESKASKIINIYKLFVLQYSIPEAKLIEAGGWSNLAEILPYVKDQESAEELVDMVINNPRNAVKNILLEKKTGVSQSECKHLRKYTIDICEDCGIKLKVYEDN